MKSKEHFKAILIVDDSGTARLIIRQCLEIVGFIVGFNDINYIEAANGHSALEVVSNNKVDLIVTDINMPVMDGKTLLRELKAQAAYKDIATIVITSSFNEAQVQELTQLGADAVINKPVTPANILAALG